MSRAGIYNNLTYHWTPVDNPRIWISRQSSCLSQMKKTSETHSFWQIIIILLKIGTVEVSRPLLNTDLALIYLSLPISLPPLP